MKKLLLTAFILMPIFLTGCNEEQPVVVEQPTEEQLEKRDKMTEVTEKTPGQSF